MKNDDAETIALAALARLDELELAALRLCEAAENLADRWQDGRDHALYRLVAPRSLRRRAHEVRVLIGRDL